jgi:hypothetical protein
MKTLKMTGLLILAANAAAFAVPKKMKSDDLSNMIIEGENRLRVSEKAPAPSWSPDKYKEMAAVTTDETMFLAFRPPAIAEPMIVYPQKSALPKTASPWIEGILQTPVLTLNVKPNQSAADVEWVFLVKNSKGVEIVHTKKKGKMPEKIEWDGFDATGKPLQVGGDYNYSLSIIDEAGNPQHVAGKPFRVDAFRYESMGRHVTLFTPPALFTGDSELKFSKNGLAALTEVKDSLRGLTGKKLDVVTYDDDERFGLARAQAIRDFLTKELDWAPARSTARSAPTKDGQGYSHVEIIAK